MVLFLDQFKYLILYIADVAVHPAAAGEASTVGAIVTVGATVISGDATGASVTAGTVAAAGGTVSVGVGAVCMQPESATREITVRTRRTNLPIQPPLQKYSVEDYFKPFTSLIS